MIYITHPLEGESDVITEDRIRWGTFLTNKIITLFPDRPVINFPLNFILSRRELDLPLTYKEMQRSALQFLAKADAAILIRFPGVELCPRSELEMKTIHRLNIPVAELPFNRIRFDQQYKQNALLGDQKRVLNILRASLEEA